MQSPTLERYFAMVQGQRESLYRRIENLPPETIWKKPASHSESGGTWSVGQNLEHVNKFMRLFRWLCTVYLPIAVPIARRFLWANLFPWRWRTFTNTTPLALREPHPKTNRNPRGHTPICEGGWTANGSEPGDNSKTFPRRWPGTSAIGTTLREK